MPVIRLKKEGFTGSLFGIPFVNSKSTISANASELKKLEVSGYDYDIDTTDLSFQKQVEKERGITSNQKAKIADLESQLLKEQARYTELEADYKALYEKHTELLKEYDKSTQLLTKDKKLATRYKELNQVT